jgi:hypothetical protein
LTSLQLVRTWAREMIGGHLPAIDGARRIAEARSEGLEHLVVFQELVAEWDRDASGREDCERRILEQASLLLADTA